MQQHNGQSFFKEEFCAWPSGAALNEIYREYMRYSDIDEDLLPLKVVAREEVPSLRPKEQKIADDLLTITQNLDTSDLCRFSQLGPWEEIYDEKHPNHANKMSKQKINKYFENYNIAEFFESLGYSL